MFNPEDFYGHASALHAGETIRSTWIARNLSVQGLYITYLAGDAVYVYALIKDEYFLF